ncbi:Hypothetical predicted protein [Mytilus galloprovincialis]|uniref:Sphingomyelin synthase-like domain-containing protein n=1 Tax=Mytilus galloprovincialis TaxID=29158 RepID=A0A8B6D8U3_MYTGA|nr:Hypothetical predicted protein [Mytilus galloprovincialis]
MKKFRIRNPFSNLELSDFNNGIQHLIKYIFGLDDDETENNEALLPQHDKNGNKEIHQSTKVYCEQHLMDGRVFLSLTDENGQPALPVTDLNNPKQVMLVMQSLKPQNGTNGHNQNGSKNDIVESESAIVSGKNGHANGYTNGYKNGHTNGHSVQFIEIVPGIKGRKNNGKLDQEMWKFGLAAIYVLFVHFFSTFCIVVAQSRLPDKTKFRPLPDLLLDNVPYIPWAYRVTEGIIYSLFVIGIILMILHKNRFIALRRGLLISGTVYLMRAICIVMTNLPMPQEKYNCDRLEFTNNWAKLRRALIIYLGMGMKVTGMKTCGDYMFSGHTVIITLLILYINQYTPQRWYFFHIFIWILGLTGISFIFLSHGHYSIDVIVAFFIASKMFVTHHVIGDNMSLMKRRHGLLRKWFPIVYISEHNSQGIIPNEYEWPFPSLTRIKRIFRGKSLTEYIVEI